MAKINLAEVKKQVQIGEAISKAISKAAKPWSKAEVLASLFGVIERGRLVDIDITRLFERGPLGDAIIVPIKPPRPGAARWEIAFTIIPLPGDPEKLIPELLTHIPRKAWPKLRVRSCQGTFPKGDYKIKPLKWADPPKGKVKP